MAANQPTTNKSAWDRYLSIVKGCNIEIMGLKSEDDKRPSKLAIMDDISDTPTEMNDHTYIVKVSEVFKFALNLAIQKKHISLG
ncbi:hypothetical protein RR46_06129 [Papilio xuthus]|uniref:Uncharacterized protein n=1 Tax=Papilio xuthus TaxID=66420 RepID=A0A194Q8I2_PAPXU|nr:hypothetical protein RR46_06129 [Papilio xuthus]